MPEAWRQWDQGGQLRIGGWLCLVAAQAHLAAPQGLQRHSGRCTSSFQGARLAGCWQYLQQAGVPAV